MNCSFLGDSLIYVALLCLVELLGYNTVLKWGCIFLPFSRLLMLVVHLIAKAVRAYTHIDCLDLFHPNLCPGKFQINGISDTLLYRILL